MSRRWMLDGIEALSHAFSSLPRPSFVISSALKIPASFFRASATLLRLVMSDFNPTSWGQSHGQHTYSEGPNRPENIPTIGESSSIQQSVVLLTQIWRSKVIWLPQMTPNISTMVMVPVHQQYPTPSTIQLFHQLGHPVRKPKYHSSADINLIFLVSSFPHPSVGHPTDVPHGRFTNHYPGHQPTGYYRTPYTSWLGSPSTANQYSLGDQAPMDTTFLPPPPPTTSNELHFFSQQPSR